MAEETTRRNPAAKKTTATTKKSVGSAKANTGAPATREAGSTSAESAMSARNNVTQGNGTMDSDAIRRRAYELYEQRGGKHGTPEEDWFRAETELLGRGSSTKRSA